MRRGAVQRFRTGRRLAAFAGLVVVLGACGRRIGLPAEPDTAGTPGGEIAYYKKYRWEGMPLLADLVITRGGLLFAIADWQRILGYASYRDRPTEDPSLRPLQPVVLGNDTLSVPVQLCEGARESHRKSIWVAFEQPQPTLVEFDTGSLPPRLVSDSFVRDPAIASFGGIAADPESGFVYVADAVSSTVVKYAPSATGGRRVALLGGQGNGDFTFQQPHGLYWFHDSLLVADTGKAWLQVISADVPGRGRGQIAGPEAEPLQLNQPLDVWVDDLGYYYVADAGVSRALKVTPQGRLKENVTEYEPVEAPNTLAANRELVWVAEPGPRRLTIYRLNTNIENEP